MSPDPIVEPTRMKVFTLPRVVHKGRDGKFGVFFWGPRWGYHFKDGVWTKGQVAGAGQHGGLDVLCDIGTPVILPLPGKVVSAGYVYPDDPETPFDETTKSYGLRILLRSSLEFEDERGHKFLPFLTIGHLSDIAVKTGQFCEAGIICGSSGNTGNAGVPHVHIQLEKPGSWPRTPIPFKWEA